MDLKKIISDIAEKLTGDKDLIAKFTSDPAGVVKSLLGIDLDGSDLASVVKGVTEKLGGDALKDAGGLLDKVKGLFGK